MRALPTGTVTFLFTDIEGSTRLLHERGEEYADLLAEHRRVLRAVFASHDGVEVDTQGDAFFVAFARAADATAAAGEIQSVEGPVRVRIGIHTGSPVVTDEGYVGLDVHRAARICAAAHGGQVVLSEATVRSLGVDPGRDLGLHRLKDFGAPEHLYQLGQDPFSPLRSLNATNLPAKPGALIGRAQEVREIPDVIDTARLVTLTGAGGSGKTRLALQVAAESVDRFGGGVFWVQLAAVTDPDLIETTIAQAIGADHGLVPHIDEKRMLLLLDNLEQLLPGAAAPLSELMSACPNLRLLTTSRAPLRIAGEREYAVLPLPDADALELFRERAFITEPAAAVEEICRRLDGLPLAIELAAAQTRVLPPDQLLARLERALPILTGGRRDAPERQRTLRATIGWSHDLLSDGERQVFDRLGVFVGGFTLEAAEAVCDADLATIGSLLEQSLLRRLDDGRLGMLQTVLEFAVERFDASDEAPATLARHADFFLVLARSARLAVESQGNERVEIVLPELANLRAVLERSLADGDFELGLSLAVTLEQFWTSNSPAEGTRWIEALLDGGPVSPVLHARALRVLGGSLYIVGRFEEGTEYHRQSLAEFRRLGDSFAVSHMLFRLAIEASRSGDPALALALVEESQAENPDPSPWAEAQALSLLGNLAHDDGRAEEALDLLDRSAKLAEQAGAHWWRVNSLLAAAEYAIELDRPDQSDDLARTGLAVARDIGDRQSMAYGLGLLARVAAARGRPERAGRLWGAIEAEQERADLGQWKLERDAYQERVFIVAGDAFERGRRVGRTSSFDDAVGFALGTA